MPILTDCSVGLLDSRGKARQTRPWGQHDVGHEGIVTGRNALSLRSFSEGSGSTLARRKPCSARKRV